jgi:hypothetical protein
MVGPNYFTPARGDSTQPTKAIVLLTDVFGLPLPNPRIVADHLAEHVGVDVWIPDFFNGGLPSQTLRFLQLIVTSSPKASHPSMWMTWSPACPIVRVSK